MCWRCKKSWLTNGTMLFFLLQFHASRCFQGYTCDQLFFIDFLSNPCSLKTLCDFAFMYFEDLAKRIKYASIYLAFVHLVD